MQEHPGKGSGGYLSDPYWRPPGFGDTDDDEEDVGDRHNRRLRGTESGGIHPNVTAAVEEVENILGGGEPYTSLLDEDIDSPPVVERYDKNRILRLGKYKVPARSRLFRSMEEPKERKRVLPQVELEQMFDNMESIVVDRRDDVGHHVKKPKKFFGAPYLDRLESERKRKYPDHKGALFTNEPYFGANNSMSVGDEHLLNPINRLAKKHDIDIANGRGRAGDREFLDGVQELYDAGGTDTKHYLMAMIGIKGLSPFYYAYKGYPTSNLRKKLKKFPSP